ncbi:SipW-dependent-type signal peptide-containing protein [Halorubrum sp. BOL3-1]|uniref:SipW-dependent-type signal peptide-containing protein n=1 Tax=Halorubrum sp. BOL3-1 TaxID=2497325 RepID=UPI0019D6A91C|nr:SipW-dependent-type signal peptide-containing protein [Halorubrum sp. BOL3-1]
MSSDNNMDLSRRKILAGMGAVGAAGAGAGLGTSALFNDTERFENNQLTAGQLDLKMDWEEHYSFPQIYDDFDDPTVEGGNDLDVIREDPADVSGINEDNYTGLPVPETDAEGRDPVVWARNNDDPTGTDESSLELYFANTVIEAFPDDNATDPKGTFTTVDDDGIRVQTPCNTLSSVPEPGLLTYNEDGVANANFQNPGRTFNTDTYDSDAEAYNPLLNLTDVKPGDFGEFTFSTHLCDNPGYLWLQMPGGLTEAENGVTEAEAESPNEDGTVSDPGSDPELAENVETTVWYDNNCNNRIDGAAEPLVVLAVLDTSESQKNVLTEISNAGGRYVERLAADADADVYAGVITLDDTGDDRDAALQSLSNPDRFPITDVENYVDSDGNSKLTPGGDIVPGSGEVGGNSPLPHALDVAREYLNDQVANDPNGVGIPSNANKEIILLSDGSPGYGTGGGNSVAGRGKGALIDADSENQVTGSDGNIVSDFFDGLANNSTIGYPNPGNPPNDTQRAETALVARDIDGEVFAPGTAEEQSQAAKVDNPNKSGDPDVDISGGDGITVRSIVSYDPGGNVNQSLAENTMQAISTGQGSGNFYNLGDPENNPEDVGDDVFGDTNVQTGGEEIIFRGTLDELAVELDPDQNGPVALDFDRVTDAQDPYPPTSTHCFGLAWWVPEEVGNQIQSDSVGFDLGFVTEQAQNNDDPGQTFGF